MSDILLLRYCKRLNGRPLSASLKGSRIQADSYRCMMHAFRRRNVRRPCSCAVDLSDWSPAPGAASKSVQQLWCTKSSDVWIETSSLIAPQLPHIARTFSLQPSTDQGTNSSAPLRISQNNRRGPQLPLTLFAAIKFQPTSNGFPEVATYSLGL